jgi:hypothetical protein
LKECFKGTFFPSSRAKRRAIPIHTRMSLLDEIARRPSASSQ